MVQISTIVLIVQEVIEAKVVEGYFYNLATIRDWIGLIMTLARTFMDAESLEIYMYFEIIGAAFIIMRAFMHLKAFDFTRSLVNLLHMSIAELGPFTIVSVLIVFSIGLLHRINEGNMKSDF